MSGPLVGLSCPALGVPALLLRVLGSPHVLVAPALCSCTGRQAWVVTEYGRVPGWLTCLALRVVPGQRTPMTVPGVKRIREQIAGVVRPTALTWSLWEEGVCDGMVMEVLAVVCGRALPVGSAPPLFWSVLSENPDVQTALDLQLQLCVCVGECGLCVWLLLV